jgi:hypothetical protein
MAPVSVPVASSVAVALEAAALEPLSAPLAESVAGVRTAEAEVFAVRALLAELSPRGRTETVSD